MNGRYFVPFLIAAAACAPAAPDDRQNPIQTINPGGPATSTAPSIDDPGVAPSDEPGLADIELCDAKDYRPLIGAVAANQTFPIGPEFRVYGVDDIITQEYLPNRTNVVVSAEGLVFRVYCG